MSKSPFLLHVGALVTSNSYSQAVAILSGIVIARWIAPADYGIWVALNLLPSYVVWMQLGTANGLGRELPRNLGKGAEAATAQLTGAGLVFSVAAAIVAALILLFTRHWTVVGPYPVWRDGIYVMAGYTLLMLVTSFLFTVGRSYREFPTIALLISLQTTISLALLPLVKAHGVYGLYFRLLAGQLFILLGYSWYFRRHLSVCFDWMSIKRLIRIGFPIFLAGYAAQLFSIADRTLLVMFLTPYDIGIFGFALFVYTAVVSGSASVCEVLLPEIAFEYGRNPNRSALWGLIRKQMYGLAILVPVPLVVGWMSLPWALSAIAPKYQSAAQPARILMFSGILWGGATIVGNVLSTVGWAWAYAGAVAGCAAILWLAGYTVLNRGYGIIGIAWANLFSIALFCATTIFLAIRATAETENRTIAVSTIGVQGE